MDSYHILALNHMDGIGPVRMANVIASSDSLEAIFKEPNPANLRNCGLSSRAIDQIVNFDRQYELHRCIETDLEWSTKADHYLMLIGDPNYPELLQQIHQPPPVLYLTGAPSRLNNHQLAMVGSRKCSSLGRQTARRLAREISELGLTVTSGLAAGIDGECHRGAMLENGRTVAVLGTGIDRVYPSQHRNLAREISAQGGLLVSEFGLGVGPSAGNFPRRNRIISGLGLGTVVVEADLKSGSLITARLAMEQNREVFAIPGSVYNASSRGCHKLIQDGAKLVGDLTDILQELPVGLRRMKSLESGRYHAPDGIGFSRLEAQLIDVLDFHPLPVDLVVETLQLPVKDVLAGLAKLEIKQQVVREGQGYRLNVIER